MSMVIFQEEVDRDASKVESILLGKNCIHQHLIICFFVGGHLVHGNHIGVHFEKQVTNDVH